MGSVPVGVVGTEGCDGRRRVASVGGAGAAAKLAAAWVIVLAAGVGTQTRADVVAGAPRMGAAGSEAGVEEFDDQAATTLLARLTSAYAARDPVRFAALFAADVEVRDVNRRQVARGRQAWQELSQRVMAAHVWMKLEAEPFATGGASASVRLRWSGRLLAGALGTSQDVEYSYEGVSLMSFEHGLIATHELFIDYASFLDQIGDVDSQRRVRSAEAAWSRYVEAWASGDVERIVPFFEPDARLMPGGTDAEIEGREAFGEWLRRSTAGVRFSVALDSRELAVHGVEAVRRGRYRTTLLAPDGSETHRSGWFMQVWRFGADGSWRVLRGLFNRDD